MGFKSAFKGLIEYLYTEAEISVGLKLLSNALLSGEPLVSQPQARVDLTSQTLVLLPAYTLHRNRLS
jgi:hypothetical protein